MITKMVPGVGLVTSYEDAPVQKSEPKPETKPVEMGERYIDDGNTVRTVDEIVKAYSKKTKEGVAKKTDAKPAEALEEDVKLDEADEASEASDAGKNVPETTEKEGGKSIDEAKPTDYEPNDSELTKDKDSATSKAKSAKTIAKKAPLAPEGVEETPVEEVTETPGEEATEEGSVEEPAEAKPWKVAAKSLSIGDIVTVPGTNYRGTVQRLALYMVKSETGSEESVRITVKGGGKIQDFDISEVMPQ